MLASVNSDLPRTPSSRAAAIRTRPRRAATYRRWEIKAPAKALAPKAITKVETLLDTQFGIAIDKNDKTQLFDSKSVSASFGRTILIGALYAIIFSMFLIVAYLTFRFEFKYALPTIVALFHDVIITIGVYSLTGRVVTAATVAAVLTVLGYSLYDTIIVFDRVRENTPLLRKNSFAQIVNVSIWETLTRSLNTSMITLFPIATLLVFGGSTLKDFAFALLIGIASGAYSSIFIAAPLLSVWKGHETEFRRREAIGIEKATLGTVAPGMAGGTGGGAHRDGDGSVHEARRGAPRGRVGAGGGAELSEQERAAREAARRRREERRRKPGQGARPQDVAATRPGRPCRRARRGAAEAAGGDPDAELREAAVEHDPPVLGALHPGAHDRVAAARTLPGAPGEILAEQRARGRCAVQAVRQRGAGVVVELARRRAAGAPGGRRSARGRGGPQRPAAVLGAHAVDRGLDRRAPRAGRAPRRLRRRPRGRGRRSG